MFCGSPAILMGISVPHTLVYYNSYLLGVPPGEDVPVLGRLPVFVIKHFFHFHRMHALHESGAATQGAKTYFPSKTTFQKLRKINPAGMGSVSPSSMPNGTNPRKWVIRIRLANLALLNFSPPPFLRSSPISHFLPEGSL